MSFTLIFDADGAPELDNGWIIQHHPPPDKGRKKIKKKIKIKGKVRGSFESSLCTASVDLGGGCCAVLGVLLTALVRVLLAAWGLPGAASALLGRLE